MNRPSYPRGARRRRVGCRCRRSSRARACRCRAPAVRADVAHRRCGEEEVSRWWQRPLSTASRIGDRHRITPSPPGTSRVRGSSSEVPSGRLASPMAPVGSPARRARVEARPFMAAAVGATCPEPSTVQPVHVRPFPHRIAPLAVSGREALARTFADIEIVRCAVPIIHAGRHIRTRSDRRGHHPRVRRPTSMLPVTARQVPTCR